MEETVLCVANSYERKFYLNPEFASLPESIRQELQIMCVLYTEDVGGIFMVVYNEDGELELKVEHASDDFAFDEIGRLRNCSVQKKSCLNLWNCTTKCSFSERS